MVFKIHPEAVIPLRGSYVDIFPFLAFFVLFFSALFFLLKGKRVIFWRRILQIVSLFLFIYFTQECFCFIRNAFLSGVPLIGKDELLSFGYLILFIFIISFALIFGRIFCGWVCPFGFLQDIFYFFGKKIFKNAKKKLFIFILFSAIIGGFFSIVLLRPSQDILIQFIPNFLAAFLLIILIFYTLNSGLESKLKKMRFFVFFFWLGLIFAHIYTFQPWCYLYGATTGEYGIRIALFLIIVASSLYYRSYCRFICPVGVLLYFCSKYSIFNLKKEDCKKCGKCKQVCLLQNIDEGRLKDKGDCILCGRCIEKDGFRVSLK